MTEYVLYYDPAPNFIGNVPINYKVKFADGSVSEVNDVVIVEKPEEPKIRCPTEAELRQKEKKVMARSRNTKAIFMQCHEYGVED